MKSENLPPVWELKIEHYGDSIRKIVIGWPNEKDPADIRKYFHELEEYGAIIKIVNPTQGRLENETLVRVQTREMRSARFLTPPEVGKTIEDTEYGHKFIVRRF